MSERKIQSRAETLNSFSVATLLKLVALQADAGHDGDYTIIAHAGRFKALYGRGAPYRASDVPPHDTLKEALVALLVDGPTFAEGTDNNELDGQESDRGAWLTHAG
jgi:hypothetical protein